MIAHTDLEKLGNLLGKEIVNVSVANDHGKSEIELKFSNGTWLRLADREGSEWTIE